jgi:hypothetical protein
MSIGPPPPEVWGGRRYPGPSGNTIWNNDLAHSMHSNDQCSPTYDQYKVAEDGRVSYWHPLQSWKECERPTTPGSSTRSQQVNTLHPSVLTECNF